MQLYAKACKHENGRTMFAPTQIMIQKYISINIFKGAHFSYIMIYTYQEQLLNPLLSLVLHVYL